MHQEGLAPFTAKICHSFTDCLPYPMRRLMREKIKNLWLNKNAKACRQTHEDTLRAWIRRKDCFLVTRQSLLGINLFTSDGLPLRFYFLKNSYFNCQRTSSKEKERQLLSLSRETLVTAPKTKRIVFFRVLGAETKSLPHC